MRRKVLSSIISIILVMSFLFSMSVSATAVSGVERGTMRDTSTPDGGYVDWVYTYNTITGKATLSLSGNGYMPNGTDQDWFQVQQNAGCYIYEVTIAEGVKSIMSNAFEGEIYLQEVKLPSTIERIGERAFANTAITKFNIPEKVSYVNGAMFTGSPITQFTVDTNSPYYKSSDGNVYSKDMSTLVVAAPGKFIDKDYNFIIPKSVTEIGESAFYNTGITSVTIPSNVKSIRKMAFAHCDSLAEVILQNGVECLYDNVFLSCDSLKEIHLPSSVNYIGYCSIGYRYDVAFDALAEALDEAGIYYLTLNLLNYEYYSVQAGYSANAFSYCYADKTFRVYAPKGSVGEQYAENNGLQYIKSSNLTGAVNTYNGVTVTWSYSDTVSHYNIYRKNLNGYWQYLTTLDGSATRYVDTDAFKNSDNTYTIRVYYYTGSNSCDTGGVTTHYVPAPVLKSIGNNVGGIRVNWNAVKNAKYYYVYRKALGDTSWKYLSCVAGNTLTYYDATPVGNKTYTYTIRAYDGVSASGYDLEGLTVTYVKNPSFTVYNTPTDVTIRWTPEDKADYYRIYRKTGTGSWQLLSTVNGNIVAYADKTALRGTTYTYTVRAVYNGTLSCYYPQGTTIKSITAPMTLNAQNRVSGVMVSWNKCTGADGYYVYRKAPSGSWLRIATLKGNGTLSYLDTTAKNGGNYIYTVKGYSGAYMSSYDASGVATKFISTPKISSAVSSKNGISLKYNTVSGSQGYYIYRKTVTGSWNCIGKVTGGAASTYLDKTAQKGQTYIYTVRAYNGSALSSYYSNTAKIKDNY